jgi:UDP-N-acetylmuramate: L-alanyl-gamma-D-glutamyl-meso-diaminopimelate ligase
MHVHLVGVCGTGMGSLAGLLTEAGHRVTGSDTAFHPPMGPLLARWGVETRPGWDAANLTPAPDLVVVGNVCRRDNPEARAAIDGGLPYTSMPGALEQLFLSQRRGFVVSGTHGKTTTTALLAHLLADAGRDPGFLLGGVPKAFGRGFQLGGQGAPFVIEGDEYDSAFFEKTPKMWRYQPQVAILTSLEHDHVDIYPDADAYREAFVEFVRRIPEDGLLVAWAGSDEVRRVAAHARCQVRFYGLEGDDWGDVTPVWMGAPVAPHGGAHPMDLFIGGTSCGRVLSPIGGMHNLRNVLAAFAAAAEGDGVPVATLVPSLARFAGVQRRQDLLGVSDGVRVYDDFAHHPTAVRETLRGLRQRHPEGRLLAAYEPRSATASRRTHQALYESAFAAADQVWIAPVGRPEIAQEERLDTGALAATLGAKAHAPESLDALVQTLVDEARAGDTLVLMSNGTFGGVHDRVLAALAVRAAGRRLASARATG